MIAGESKHDSRKILPKIKWKTKDEENHPSVENAQNTASINANTTAGIQKILDTLAQNKIDALENKVASLELQNNLANVVRYPNGYTYNAGQSPFCNNGCGCGCGF